MDAVTRLWNKASRTESGEQDLDQDSFSCCIVLSWSDLPPEYDGRGVGHVMTSPFRARRADLQCNLGFGSAPRHPLIPQEFKEIYHIVSTDHCLKQVGVENARRKKDVKNKKSRNKTQILRA